MQCTLLWQVGASAIVSEKQQEILKGLGVSFKARDNLTTKLITVLGTKGYLLILDDLWDWRHEQKPQLEELFGSKWREFLTKGT